MRTDDDRATLRAIAADELRWIKEQPLTLPRPIINGGRFMPRHLRPTAEVAS